MDLERVSRGEERWVGGGGVEINDMKPMYKETGTWKVVNTQFPYLLNVLPIIWCYV